MKMVKETKFFRKQAEKAARMALATSDEEASQSLSNLAQAYCSQADALKESKKLKKSKKMPGKKRKVKEVKGAPRGLRGHLKKTGCYDRLGAADESAAAIVALLKHS